MYGFFFFFLGPDFETYILFLPPIDYLYLEGIQGVTYHGTHISHKRRSGVSMFKIVVSVKRKYILMKITINY